MTILAVRNFTSAATGLVVAIALIRGLVRRSAKTIGNFWVDLTRGDPLHPAADRVVFAIVLVWQGVPQTLERAARPSPPCRARQQTIAIGPIASQEIIKELGNNGGGFLNANSAHPFENPTPLTNFLEMFAMFAIPFALTYTFGRYAGNQRQGWTIFGAMAAVFLVGAVVAMHSEAAGNPLFPAGVDQALGNMEGKDIRFGSAVGGALRRDHDEHEHRRDQRLARQLPADRRARPALQHGARRDHARAASAPACTGCSSSARSCRSSSPG